MMIIESVKEMESFSRNVRGEGKTISFVPTMGYLHEGHLSLMKEGRKSGDCLVTSIYVNPTQFGVGEDFEKYPRDMARDRRMAEKAGVDIIFCPANREMYPQDYMTYVNVEGVTDNLCGLSRPGHFRGVATVCCKLFNIVRPRRAFFGKKDFQQFVVIRRMVEDLNMDVEIIGMPTVREADGLAMSSRNVYMSDGERKTALRLSRSLVTAKKMYDEGQRDASSILSEVVKGLNEDPVLKLEYAKICDANTLKELPRLAEGAVLALAAKVGKTRLIDNYVFGDQLSWG